MALLFALSISLSGECVAQQDSLSDVFPLAIGHKWIYGLDNAQSGMGTLQRDIGVCVLQVIAVNTSADSIRWQIAGWRDFTRSYSDHGTPTGTDVEHDSVSIEIIEFTAGHHELYVLSANSDVFPLWRLVGDSIRFYRYVATDTSGSVSINRCRCGLIPNTYRNLRFQKNTGITTSSGSVLGSVGSWNWSYSLTSFSPAYRGPYLSHARSISFAALTGLASDTTIALASSGTEPVTISNITSSDPALSVTASSSFIPAVGSVQLTLKHRSPPNGTSSYQLVIVSSSVTSPDTIDVTVQGRMAAVLKTNNHAYDFGSVFYSRRHLDTAFSIINSGNLPLTIDSLHATPVWSASASLKWQMNRTTVNPGDSATCTVSLTMDPNTRRQQADLSVYSNASSTPDVIRFLGTIMGGIIIFSSHSISLTSDVDGMDAGVLGLYVYPGGVFLERTRPSHPAFTIRNTLPNPLPNWWGYADTIQFTPRRGGVHAGFIVYSSRSTQPGDTVTAIDTVWLSGNARPLQFALYQNYPNPFNPRTTIGFDIPDACFVTLKIFDFLGREVATLVNEDLAQGGYERMFDGRTLASGVYVYRLQAGGVVRVRKLILIK